MDWARILAFVTGTVDQELLARIEYLAAENRILKAQLKGRLQLSDAERATLGEIGHRLAFATDRGFKKGETSNVSSWFLLNFRRSHYQPDHLRKRKQWVRYLSRAAGQSSPCSNWAQ
jgi:hypothetical protein